MDNLAVSRTIDLRASVSTGVGTIGVPGTTRVVRAARIEAAAKAEKAVRLRLILTLVAVIGFILVYTFIIADYKWSDPVPDQISQYLLQEGYDVNDIYFVRVKYRVGHMPDIYQSSVPVRYKDRMTEFWEVRSISKLTRTYYIISPYYGETS